MKLPLTVLVVGLVVLFSYGGADAADGNGVCEPGEVANLECAQLGTFTLELLTPVPIQTTCSEVPVEGAQGGGFLNGRCTAYAYRFSGLFSGDNQINILIPARFLVADASCQQFNVDGTGDSTTGFGKGIRSHNNCRTAQNLNPPSGVNIVLPLGTNMLIVTSPALVDGTNTLLKAGKNLFYNQILGPGSEVPQVTTTSQTVTTGDGVTLTIVTDQGGNVVSFEARNPDGSLRPVTVLDLGDLQLCIQGVCTPLSFVTNNTDLKVTGTDPCKVLSGKSYCY